MARPRKLWRHHEGPYGARVTIREPRPGHPLRWDYRKPDGIRYRGEVDPQITIRPRPDAPVDPAAERAAQKLLKQKYAELTLGEAPKPRARSVIDPDTLTVGAAFALFNDPKYDALPASDSGQRHHAGGRVFWEKKLGADTLWNDVLPAHVEGAVRELVKKDQVPTALKRLQTLRTMTKWLQRKMRIRGLEDPTIGVEAKEIGQGYVPRRPRLTHKQVDSLTAVLPKLSWRSRLFYTLLIPSGTRAIQARQAMRSELNAPLEPAVPDGLAPHGWFVFKGVKGQAPHVTFLTHRQREEIDSALQGPLAAWEAQYQAGTLKDYPLVPGGRVDDWRGTRRSERRKYRARPETQQFILKPVTDRTLRNELVDVFIEAGIAKTEHMGFHAVRRAWTDYMHEKEGLDTAASAGGWSRRETVEESYLSTVRHSHLERARKQMEGE